ncbi:rhodanese-like domain-containing protein [Gillisia marina]|uniref:rhodanese-like domain-containing protein n=1 Tax=Gillisia marina TaxID=1167637 RepID=UPI00029B4E8B|nr:rhodanese-like domain-containing protein [Gillisia marina]
MRVYLFLVIIIFIIQGCEQSKAKEIQIITTDEVKTHSKYGSDLKNEIKSKDDFKKSHLVSAESIITNEGSLESINSLDKDSPIAIYFTSENKTQEAAMILKRLGFRQIYILDGGIKKWSGDMNVIK